MDTHPLGQKLVVSATFTHPQGAGVGTAARARDAGEWQAEALLRGRRGR